MRLHLHKRHTYWLVDHRWDHGQVWDRQAYATFEAARLAVIHELSAEMEQDANQE
jgi:hypothetical protein